MAQDTQTMTISEFLSMLQSRGAKLAASATTQKISLTNAALRQNRLAMLPKALTDIYETTGAINLDTGYIFGPNSIERMGTFPIPDIVSINNDIAAYNKTNGITIFGRNDLFWFAYDAFGTFYMLDNLSLKPLRKYNDIYRAITDCLMAGKI